MTTYLMWGTVQVLGGQVVTLIGNYLNSPPHAPAVSIQETLYDEDIWARVLDVQSILFLVRPFIAGVQTLDITEIAAASNRPCRGPGRRLNTPGSFPEDDTELPPPYEDFQEDPETFMKSNSYKIIRASQRLVEILSTASAGPSGSSPRAWSLNVTAAVEVGLQLLALYNATTSRMSSAPEGSFLALIRKKLNLLDEDLLEEARRRFTPVLFSRHSKSEGSGHVPYRLRLPAHYRYLAINHESRWFDTSAEKGRPPRIGRQGDGHERVIFVPVEETPTTGEASATEEKHGLKLQALGTAVHYGMLVKVAAFTDKSSEPLFALASSLDGDKPAIFRVVHSDERYRSQSIGRAVAIRDRIVLMEQNTQKLLTRTAKKNDEWSVEFGTSDDFCWTVTAPM